MTLVSLGLCIRLILNICRLRNTVSVCVCVCVRACVRACVGVGVVYVQVRARECAHRSLEIIKVVIHHFRILRDILLR